MYEYNKVMNGVAKYIDTEIVDKISGWKKWVIGSGAGLLLSNANDVFNQLKNNEVVKLLNIIDKDDKIDVDKIYQELKKQAQKGAITFNMAMIGPITLNQHDVDRLYELIKEE